MSSSPPPNWPPPGEPNPFRDSTPYQPPTPFQPPPQQSLADDTALRWIIPVGTSIWAILAGYSGLISFGCCPLGPLAVVFGIVAIYDIQRNPKIGGMGRAIFGIVSGSIGTIELVLWIVVMVANQGR